MQISFNKYSISKIIDLIFDNFDKLSKYDTYNTDYVIYFDQQQSLWCCEYLKYISLDQLLYKLFNKTYCTFSLVE